MQAAAQAGLSAQKAMLALSRQTLQIQNAFNSLSKAIQPAFESMRKTGEWLSQLDKAGLTPNLGESRSIKRLKEYQRLLSMGYAIFWVPRAEVVDELLSAKTVGDRKLAITGNKELILEDCKKVTTGIQSKALKDHRMHLLSSIESMESRNYRSAQSTANVCFDALFDHLIDGAALNNFSQVNTSIRTTSDKLKNYMELPAQFLYAALQAQLVITMLRKFDRLNPNTVHLKYGRHSSAHTVSAKQFNEHNALQAIMVATSILATTDKLGKNWMTNLGNYI